MGSYAYLGLGRLELTWSKNWAYPEHSRLFLPSDLATADYHYVDGHTERKPAYVRTLGEMLRRLELLGYGERHLKKRFENVISSFPDHYDPPSFSFDRLADALRTVDVQRVRNPEEGDYDLGEFVQKVILEDPVFKEVVPEFTSLDRDSLTYLENMDAELILGLLARNPSNYALPVEWRYHDVVEGGWVEKELVKPGIADEARYLIVTEGSTDSSILNTALPYVASDVEDFFDFIDMTDRYPFTGTGNVVRFCEGLFRVGPQRKILIVLDNDAEGRHAFGRISSLDLPSNMGVTLIPDVERGRSMATVGPGGESVEDVNGRAVSIEFFLDFSNASLPPPRVRWSNYVAQVDTYQGALEEKEIYTRDFFRSTKKDPATYDFRELARLWQHIISACADLSMHVS